MGNVADFIQWFFSEGASTDLHAFLRGFLEQPAFIFYFAGCAAFAVLLVWGALHFVFPRPARIAPPKWGIWVALLVFFIAFAVQVMVLVAIVVINMLSRGAALEEPSLIENALAVIISAPVICVGVYFMLRVITRRSPAADVGISLRRAPANIGRGLLLVAVMVPLFMLVAVFNKTYLSTIHADTGEQAVVGELREARTPLEIVIVCVMASIAAPAWEEFIFRGVVFNGLRKSVGSDEAILLSAALFAGVHGSVAAFVPIFFLAVLLAYAYERTGSLLTPIAMHCAFNTANLFQIFLAR